MRLLLNWIKEWIFSACINAMFDIANCTSLNVCVSNREKRIQNAVILLTVLGNISRLKGNFNSKDMELKFT